MAWQDRFDLLLEAMSQDEPHKAEERAEKAAARSKEQPKG